MSLSCGIVGLPNAGKSTIFNALTAAGSPVAPYAFCTIDPKEGTVAVPDSRLEILKSMVGPQKTTPTTLTFVDIAGLVEGASRGEGLGNRFLANIREMDALVFVVRLFQDPNVSHVSGVIEPLDDFEVVRTELLLADLESIERRLEKQQKMAKVGDAKARIGLPHLEALRAAVAGGLDAGSVTPANEEEQALTDSLFLLTCKPGFVVVNVDEAGLKDGDGRLAGLIKGFGERGLGVVPVCGKLEAELAELEDPEERAMFMEELGLAASALQRVVLEGYRLLRLVTFYTLVGTELRAWTIPRGTTAAKAAGRIHTDMEKGFIKAEVISFEVFSKAGSEQKARDRGLARIEGRDYQIQDGDIVRFHFRG